MEPFGQSRSQALEQLASNTLRFTNAAHDVVVPFAGAGYADSFAAILAANAFATMNETNFPTGSGTYLDKAMEVFEYVLSTQWDDGFVPRLSFSTADADSSNYVNDVPSPRYWSCPRASSSSLVAIPNHASTALQIFSWANLDHTDATYASAINFLHRSVEALDRWHTWLAHNRSVSAGPSTTEAEDGLLFIVHPWESVDPMAQLWSDVLPEPVSGCAKSLPADVTTSPFWGDPDSYCQALALLNQTQERDACNPAPPDPEFAVVDPYFNVAFHDSVEALFRICEYVANCSSGTLSRIEEHRNMVTWSKIGTSLYRPLEGPLMASLLSWYQAHDVSTKGQTFPNTDYRASDGVVLLIYDDADNSTTTARRRGLVGSDSENTATITPHTIAPSAAASASASASAWDVDWSSSVPLEYLLPGGTSDNAGASEVCAQLLTSPMMAPYPVQTIASTSMAVSCPAINLQLVRALTMQNFSGVAFTVAATTLAALDRHVAENDDSFPFAYASENYSQCYRSCSGSYKVSTSSAAAYLLLMAGDAPIPLALANIGLLGTEIFIGIELFVMVLMAVGFILIAVRLVRQVRRLEDHHHRKVQLNDILRGEDETGPLLGGTSQRANDKNINTDDDVIHDDALASDFLNAPLAVE